MTLLSNQKWIAGIAGTLLALLLTITIAFTTIDRDRLSDSTLAEMALATEQNAATEAVVTSDVLWLARVIYSETKRPEEQELVAWVVRNRVETEYRGRSTYRDVVLDPWQFSAFNSNGPKRNHYTNLTSTCEVAGWQTAIEIALEVMYAPETDRPFEMATRHFYSEISMVGRSHPAWANGQRPVQISDRQIDPRRFRFFSHIS